MIPTLITDVVSAQQQADAFDRRLLTWYQHHGRQTLPWHLNPSPYHTWVSEIMCQQTQVTTVIPYFERFITRFPNVAALAQATEDEVLNLWSGLGYYARGRNLHQAAQQIQTHHQGQLPNTAEALMALKGIGKSTAHAIMAQAFHLPYAILDGNVKRVLARLTMTDQPIQKTTTQRQLWGIAQALIPDTFAQNQPHVHHQQRVQAMMDVGALICQRTQPNCPNCPIQPHCAAHQHQQTHIYPIKATRKTKPCKTLYLAWVTHDENPNPTPSALKLHKQSTGLWQGLYMPPWFESKALLYKTYPQATVTGIELCHQLTHWNLTLKVFHVCQTPEPNWMSLSDAIGLPRIVSLIQAKLSAGHEPSLS